MEESSQSDKEFEWDHLNIEKKHELCGQFRYLVSYEGFIPHGVDQWQSHFSHILLFHSFAVQLLKKTKREKSVLFVKNKNLKNTIKNMEVELCKIKDALRVEECKFLQLYEKLNTKTVI